MCFATSEDETETRSERLLLASNDVTNGTLLGKVVVKPEQGGGKYEHAHHDTDKSDRHPLPNRIGQFGYPGNQVEKAES